MDADFSHSPPYACVNLSISCFKYDTTLAPQLISPHQTATLGAYEVIKIQCNGQSKNPH